MIFKEYTESIDDALKQETLSCFFSPLYAGHEFVAILNNHGIFYYMCSNEVNMEDYQERTGFCIIERLDNYYGYYIGRGLYHTAPVYGLLANAVPDRYLAGMERNICNFIADYDKGKKWYSLESNFTASFRSWGYECHYIHNFYPKACPENQKRFQGIINNTVYKFKSGEAAQVVAKLMSMAVEKQGDIIKDRENTILLCIPASTLEKHETRFKDFSRLMSRHLGIRDGYDLMRVLYDRSVGDIRRGTPVTRNIGFTDDGKPFIGKHIILCDDIHTTGRSLKGLADYLMKIGAASVTGVFLGKTRERT